MGRHEASACGSVVAKAMLGRPFLDKDQAARIKPETLKRYRSALPPFLEWLASECLAPQGAT